MKKKKSSKKINVYFFVGIALFFLSAALGCQQSPQKIEKIRLSSPGLSSPRDEVNKKISDHKEALTKNPKDAEAHYHLGMAYYHKKSNSQAALHLYQAGVLYLKQGKMDMALKAYDALKLTGSEDLEKKLAIRVHPSEK